MNKWVASFAALATASVSAAAEDLENTAARFGMRETILQISLSPSGDKIAYVSAGPGHTEVVNIVDLNGGADIVSITGNTEQIADITGCEWVTNSRLVCELYGVGNASGLLLPFTRTIAIDDDGSDMKMISERDSFRALGFRQNGGDIVALDVEGDEGRILFTKEYVKETTIGTRLANDQEGLGVDSIDVFKGSSRSVERPDAQASRYIADENGDIRLKYRDLVDGSGYLSGERVFMYRDAGKSSWNRMEPVSVNGKVRDDFAPVAVDAGRNVVYGYAKENGFDVIIEAPLDNLANGRIVMSRDDVDVDSLIRIGRQRRVVGATYATEKRAIDYFDPKLDELATALGNALPEHPLVNIIGSSADENKLLIVASSDTDPGMVYLYDKTSNQLEPLLAVRELLSEQAMSRMTPVSYKSADGTEIPAYLTLPIGAEAKNLPAIVLPHGGPAARDEWGFDWLPQFFASRGYLVLQPNYRGSAGYGEDWYGKNGYQAWETAISDINDAGRWLVSSGMADGEKLAIAGWSYGGYAALQSQVIEPDLYKAVVAIAPVTDLEYLREDARRYTNYSLRDEQLGQGPHIAAGSPLRHADRFKAPVQLFHGDLDLNVDVRHSQMMAKRLESAGKNVTYTEFDGLQHNLGDSKVRMNMLIAIDKFLASALGN
ncbi:alpha/beta fold hydrolase [Altererythrobacter aurantiacus]|uniref:Alpha/beta fold hydrolase n=1 Tax=Parapontixanthobacter aurantiacus TaxID=1463599 RepID=A0A844Z9D5_9SPHN|nr:alpha/beta fold hydrolase [Parapontixanthobacter aurantiacus]MXO85201.1 alpha/beta fold hydrolase [Parapontixanthobacter aurantiacus]